MMQVLNVMKCANKNKIASLPVRVRASVGRFAFYSTDGASNSNDSHSNSNGNNNSNGNGNEIAELQEKIKSLDEKQKETYDKLLRALAEIENVRKRGQTELEVERDYGITKFAKSLLEVSDNLERALEHVNKQDLESNEQLNNLFQGVEMTNGILSKCFANNGISKFTSLGQKFDPKVHNAISQIPLNPDGEPNSVALVTSEGYMIKQRVLRPAQVIVYGKN